MKRLFEVVENNNYNELQREIDINPNINLSYYKSQFSLLSTAVKYRAKECFDILVEFPSVITFDNSHYYNSLSVAVNYYINGRNQSNKYYIDRLIEKKMNVINVLPRSVKDIDLFFYLYDKADKTKLPFIQLISKSLTEGCMYVFDCIVDMVIGMNVINNGINTLYEILCEVILRDNMEALDILMKKNINIKQYSFLLYTAIKHGSTNTFNYFYNFYKKLSNEELNNIPNVSNLNTILYDIYYNANKMEMLNMIFKLGINFGNVATSIASTFTQSLSQYSQYSRNTIMDQSHYNVINLLFENKLVTTNPIVYLTIPAITKIVSRTFTQPHIQTNYMKLVAKFFDTCMLYNYKPTDEIQTLITKYKIPVKNT